VINSKRINEAAAYISDIDMQGSFLSNKLILYRHLGLKHVIPGSSQWVVGAEKKSECWSCTQQILTIFLWTPRIGQLTCDKDKIKTAYYQDKVE